MCIEFEDDYSVDKISKLKFTNIKPSIPGRYYASKIKNPQSRMDIVEINIANMSDIKSEMCKLIACLADNFIMFYSDYKYFYKIE